MSKQASQQDGNNKKRSATVEQMEQRHLQPNFQSAAPIVQEQHPQRQTQVEMPAGSKRFKFTMAKPNQTMKSAEEAAASWEAALAASVAPAAGSPVTPFAAPVMHQQTSSSAARASIPVSSTTKPQEEISKKPLKPFFISGAVGLTPYPIIPSSQKKAPVTAASTPITLTDSHRKAFQDIHKKAGSSVPIEPTTILDTPTLESNKPILQMQSEQIHKLIALNRDLEKKNATKDANISLMKQRITDLVAKEKHLESRQAALLQTMQSEHQSSTLAYEKLRAEHEGVRVVEEELRKHVEYLEKSLCVMQTEMERKEGVLNEQAQNAQTCVGEIERLEAELAQERQETSRVKRDFEQGEKKRLEARIGELEKQVENEKSKEKELSKRLEQGIVDLQGALSGHQAQIRQYQDKISALVQEKSGLEERVVELESLLEKLQSSSSTPSSSTASTVSSMVTMNAPSSPSAQDYTNALHHTILQQQAKMAITDATVKLFKARKELSEAGIGAEVVDQVLPMPCRSGFESLLLGQLVQNSNGGGGGASYR